MNTIDIVYSFDDKYAQHAGVSILSLLINNESVDSITFHIIDNNISQTNKDIIVNICQSYNRTIHFYDIRAITSELEVTTSFPLAAYGRIFLSDHINTNKLLYIDSDTIINGSILDLIDYEMGNYLVAGVQDSVNPYYRKTIDLNLGTRYINSGGALIINSKLWREEKITKKCLDFIIKWNGAPPHNDQGTINKICERRIKILPLKYNVMPPCFLFTSKQLMDLFRMSKYYSQEEIDESVRHPIVIHYTDEFFNRPWFSNCTHPLKHLYSRYLSLTPWKDYVYPFKDITKNCKIQNFVKKYLPYHIYKLMVRTIEFKHRYHH